MAKGQPVNKGLLVALIAVAVIGVGYWFINMRGAAKDPEVKTVAAPSDLKPVSPEEMANGPTPKALR